MSHPPTYARPAWLCAILVLALSACNNAGTSGNPAGYVPNSSTAAEPAAPLAQQDDDAVMPPGAPFLNDNGDAPDGRLSAISTYPGAVYGKDDMFKPKDGDYAGGGWGKVVDKLPCRTTMYSNRYHVHFYLGIVHDGKQIAVPDTIGIHHPGPESSGFTGTGECYYFLHTHDASGVVHVEYPGTLPYNSTLYDLQRFLKVWGVPNTPTSLGPFQGPLHVFVGNVPLKQTTVSSYVAKSGDYRKIKIQSHEVIWLEFGSTYYKANQLPPVTFYMEY